MPDTPMTRDGVVNLDLVEEIRFAELGPLSPGIEEQFPEAVEHLALLLRIVGRDGDHSQWVAVPIPLAQALLRSLRNALRKRGISEEPSPD